ncbi:CpaD family pilus assembly protein [Pseudovibrio sp. Ad37]|uniref:CpaD family pilus assembly protein n=1 Tax=Pseudovibrio sp. Ad37 TaxID=989422 RepID=UPI0007B20EC2|nr:CpaD family pilus assembly protein [Pseudovibrio sp. Ad37]KZL28205.1 Pilus biogenesis CpaD protein [Pseudovibrio sp. Ad37]
MNTLLSPTLKCVRKLREASVVLGTVAMLGACQSQPSYVEHQSIADFDYRKRHPIVITEAPENFDIPIAGETRNLNGSMKTAIAAFGKQADIDGNGFVEVLTPSGSANEIAAKTVSPQIRAALKKGGVAADHIVMRSYAISDMVASAPVRLSFMRIKGVVRDCGNWPEAMVGDSQNADYYNFGCASQSNLAAMVDNPSDLLRPRPLGPGDPARTNVILTNNRSGAVTAGEYKTGVGASVSTVGQN